MSLGETSMSTRPSRCEEHNDGLVVVMVIVQDDELGGKRVLDTRTLHTHRRHVHVDYIQPVASRALPLRRLLLLDLLHHQHGH